MQLIAVDGHRGPRRVRPRREADLYKLFLDHPELFERGTLFRLISINSRTEKGPDLLAVNRRGDLIIAEIKRGGLHAGAWAQAKYYAKRLGRMRERAFDKYLEGRLKKSRRKHYVPLRELTRSFLGPTARSAFFSPSRRKVQLLLVAEDFADYVLRDAARGNLGERLRGLVKDVKCVQVRIYRTPASKFAVASVVSGYRRRLRK